MHPSIENFYKLGVYQAEQDFEKQALNWGELKPMTQGAIKRMGQGAAIGAVPGAIGGYAASDDHPVMGTIGGALGGAALGAAGGYYGGKALQNKQWQAYMGRLRPLAEKNPGMASAFKKDMRATRNDMRSSGLGGLLTGEFGGRTFL